MNSLDVKIFNDSVSTTKLKHTGGVDICVVESACNICRWQERNPLEI